MADATSKQLQDQVLTAMKQTQEATVQAISVWGAAVDKLTARWPGGPELQAWPWPDWLPTPEEVSDQLFDFARQVLDQQQEFVRQVLAALPGRHRGMPGRRPPSGP